MSTTNLLNSAIQKLTNRPDKRQALIFNSDASKKQRANIKKRVPDLYIEDLSFVVLGAFLQNVNINDFTNDELKVLLTFDYSSIESVSLSPKERPSVLKTPYYDLDNKIINLSFKDLSSINRDFLRMHSINKSLSIEYLISYIVSQV